EVQRDQPGKEHAWHDHETDETLVIIDGSVRFYWEGGEKVCGKGMVISLPAGTRHGSVALDQGATYLIAFHDAGLTNHG
ncbi:MAG: cupin domain-containing protein, partial [Pseudomonadota bacterium]